ncbi:MAG TPA: hypothetical protein VFL42_07170 [Terriglobales bacterium]|nr:hypothetical protein [Terriglobales bacterium]
MGRKILAGVLGGLAFFAWSSFAHLATGLGETGIQEIPNEQAVISSMRSSITADGMYFFPGYGLPPTATHSQKMAAMNEMRPKIKAGPVGIIVYRRAGEDALPLSSMLTELGTNIVQVLLAIFLLGQTSLSSFAARWRFITVAGILAAISTNISYWNWLGFPGNYTLSYICIVAMGFVFAGLVAAALVKPEAKSMAVAR